MFIEKEIFDKELINSFNTVIKEINNKKTVFFVKTTKEILFVLTSLEIGQNVLGLYNEEYGWPFPVDVSNLQSIDIISPKYRRHPLLMLNKNCIGMTIQISEYNEIKKRISKI